MKVERIGPWYWPEFVAHGSETLAVLPGLSVTLPDGARGYTGALGIRFPDVFCGQGRMTLWHDHIVTADQWGPCAFSDALAMRILDDEGAWLVTRMIVWSVIFPFGVWRAGQRSARRTIDQVRALTRRAPRPRRNPKR